MNSTTFMTKAEILLYSTLTSAISGIDHFKTQLQHVPHFLPGRISEKDNGNKDIDSQQPAITSFLHWEIIQQNLLSLFLWIILGFAAGFLIGMIKPG